MDIGKSRNTQNAHLFYSDVVKWRQTGAKLWSSVIIFVTILTHIVTANHHIFDNPLYLLTGYIYTLFRINFWCYTALIIVSYWLVYAFYDKLFKFSPKVYSNNLDKLSRTINSLSSVALASSLAASVLVGYIMLQFYSSNDLNRFHIIGFCVFSSFIYKVKFTLNENYQINWPIFEQTKFNRFKSRFYSILLSVVKSMFVKLFYWHFVSYFLESWIVGIFFNDGLMDSTTFFQSLSTSFAAFKLATIIDLWHEASWNLYEIYMTEIYHFEIQPTDPSQLSLPAAMSLTSFPFIQNLALMDLNDLSVHSRHRRHQIFSLNFSTGKPINWNKISTESLSIIKGFIDIFNFDDMLHGSTLGNNKPAVVSSQQDAVLFKRIGSIHSPLTSPVKYDERHTQVSSPRSLNQAQKFQQPIQPVQNQFGFGVIQQLVQKFKKQKLVAYLYNENTHYKTQQLFVDSFLVVNVLKSLSNLITASRTEDEFGVVQQNLTEIIKAFVELLKILEKLNSSCISFKVLQKKNPDQIELLIQKLVFILNESLYKVTETFGPSLKSLNLGDDISKRLERYYLTQ